ncbi:ferric reductase NAD binding domain-containing protein [Dipodascopsis tothii]|uniref:ferric reductase NAD binding domain-containing protein n=1 Tax=Dipodascopsis tothii TaxID=44089 RepID=UPI0034D0201E
MMIQAAYVFRHHWYEIFLVLHILMAIPFIVLYHYHVGGHGYQQFFWAAIAVWAFDRVFRIVRVLYGGIMANAEVAVFGDATQIIVKPSVHFKPKPGQYAFIYVLRHNFWESHPFSIVESRDGKYHFVVKAYDGLTRKMHKHLDATGKTTARVWIEGPYGESVHMDRFNTVFLVAGGIGITAVMAYALDLKGKNKDQHIVLHWVIREDVSFNWVAQQLADIAAESAIEVTIFVTGNSNSDSFREKKISDLLPQQSKGTSITSGEDINEKSVPSSESGSISDMSISSALNVRYNEKPNVGATIDDLCQNSNGSVAVFCCGPGRLADDCRAACVRNISKTPHRVDYFEDAFSWA